MSEASNSETEMREEYDFGPEELRSGVRGKYAARYQAGVNMVAIDPDLRDVFPDAEAVNQALRAIATVIRARSEAERAA
jgi:hypothetical protein